jgi:hypothetical protein
MKYLIYGLTGLVLVCDLLFVALVALAMRPEQGADMVLMAAPLVFWPAFFASITVMLLLKRPDLSLAWSKGINRFNGFSCIGMVMVGLTM